MEYMTERERYNATQRRHVLSLLILAVVVPMLMVLYLSHLNAKVKPNGHLRTFGRMAAMGKRG